MYKAIPEVFFEIAERNSSKPAFLYKKEGVYFPVTYSEFSKKVSSLAQGLQSLGVEKGDRVAILSENRPEWAISDLAIMASGGVVVPLHTTFNPKALITILNHAKVKVLIVSSSDFLNKVLIGQRYLKHLKKIILLEKITVSQKEILSDKVIGWNAILKRNQSTAHPKLFLDPDDPCSIIYTSGTTGHPKGVQLSHRNFLSNVEAVNEVIPVKNNDIFLSFLPLSHVLERTAGYYMPLCQGATIAYAENTKQLPKNLREVRPTILIAVPRIFEKFHDAVWDKVNKSSKLQKKFFLWALKQKSGSLNYKIGEFLAFKKIKQHMGGRIRLAISGGASLNEKVGKFFMKTGITVLEGYGLTETSPVISANREDDVRFGTVGKVIPGTKVKIAENKEILVKGPNVFSEYYDNKKQTRESFNNDGWFCTGDLGFLDNEGFLTIIGRGKEMIVTSGGKNVWPERIENLLNDDKFISQTMVVGNARKFISALIVPDWQQVEIYFKENNFPLKEHDKLIKDSNLLEMFQQRLDEKINLKLNDFEKIKKFKLIPQEFSQEQEELTPTLKPRRHIIENHYSKWIGEMYN